jgi:hypothetical protein
MYLRRCDARFGLAPRRSGELIDAEECAEGASLRLGAIDHPWAVAWHGRRHNLSLQLLLTRPVSWLGPASLGAHPRTKGARCFTGGHRHRVPSTPKGLLAALLDKQRGDPSEGTEGSEINFNRVGRDSGNQSPSRPAARMVNGPNQDAHAVTEGGACLGCSHWVEQCLAVVGRRTWQKFRYGSGPLG